MLCMDYLYYVGAITVCRDAGLVAYPLTSILQEGEYDYDFAPAWRFVVTHMHWTERLESIGQLYLRSAFGLEPDQSIPPVSQIPIAFCL